MVDDTYITEFRRSFLLVFRFLFLCIPKKKELKAETKIKRSTNTDAAAVVAEKSTEPSDSCHRPSEVKNVDPPGHNVRTANSSNTGNRDNTNNNNAPAPVAPILLQDSFTVNTHTQLAPPREDRLHDHRQTVSAFADAGDGSEPLSLIHI